MPQIDLVDHGNDCEAVLFGQQIVGDRLRLDALGGIHDEQGAFAGLETFRHLEGEIDVAGGVDKVEEVLLAIACAVVQLDARSLDGDAAFPLQVHIIEHLVAEFSPIDRPAEL